MKKEVEPVSVTRKHDGSFECSTIHAGYLVHQRYYGYTKKEAVQLFREYLKAADEKAGRQ